MGFGNKQPAAFQEPAQMGVDMNSSNYGMPVALVYGRNKVSGNCGWYGDFKVQQIQAGGKGGGGITQFDYHASYMLVMCEGPIHGFDNAWQGSSYQPLANLQPAFLANGAIGQAPWSHFGGSEAIGYSGFALIGFLNNDLGSQAVTPNYQVEVDALQQFNYPSIPDALASAICTDVCTNVYHGINFSYLGDLTAWQQYCQANGLFISPVYNTETTGAAILKDLADWTNTQVYFSEGLLKFVPYGDVAVTGNGATFTPNLTPAWNFTDADYVQEGSNPPITLHRKALPDCSNTVRIQYPDRAYYYYDEMVEARDQEDAVTNGVRAETSKRIDSITTAAVARFVAQNMLQRTLYIRNTYEWRTSWRFALLEPSDVVTLTDSTVGITNALVRITKVEESDDGELSFTAEELPVGVGHSANYNTQVNGGYTLDINTDPGPVNTPAIFRAPGFLNPQNQPKIGLAVSANNALWGGAQVYISYDGTTYSASPVATINQQARYGLLILPAWAASAVMAVGQLILDSNGNTQQVSSVTSDAKTGASHPTWSATVGNTTTDNHVTWKCVALGSAALPSSVSDPDTVNLPQVTLDYGQLSGGTQASADNLQTLFMVDTELMAYESATLISGSTYQLGYLRRGAYGTAIASHAGGTTFVRLDGSVAYIPFDPSYVGKTVYLKFLSYNVFGNTVRTLAEETAYTYVIGASANLPDVPAVPGSFAAAPAPDGAYLSWTNANPAAVAVTSIERSPDNATWTVLAQVGNAHTTYHDIWSQTDLAAGKTYYYRARALGSLPQAGFSAYTASQSTTANAVTLSSITGTQRNLIPDSGLKNVGAYWTAFNGQISVTQNIDGSTNCFQYTGTGAPSGSRLMVSKIMTVTPGVYTLSAKGWVTNITSGTMTVNIYDPAITTDYGFVTLTNTRSSGQITIPSGVSQVVALFTTNNATVANGQGSGVQDMQFEPGPVMTAYRENTGDNLSGTLLIDTGNTKHVGVWMHGYMSNPTRSAIAATPDANGNYVMGFSTSQGTDDIGWSQQSKWGGIPDVPGTIAGHNLTGVVQPQLPATSGKKHIWASDSGGAPYETPIFDTSFGHSLLTFQSGATGNLGPSATAVQVGSTVVIPNPGQAVNFSASAFIQVNQNAATTAFQVTGFVRYSVDGGTTWTNGINGFANFPTTAADIRTLACGSTADYKGTPSGDIWVQFMYLTAAGAGTFQFTNGTMTVDVAPLSPATLRSGTLVDTLPTTGTANANATYPATTASAGATLVGGSTGGMSPVTYSNSRTGNGTGTSDGGTITSGATASIFTMATATLSPGTYTGVYSQTATDSTTPTHQTSTVNCTVTSTITQVYAAISPSLSVTGASCSTGTGSGTCTATGNFTVSATGGNGSYTYSNSVYSYDAGFSTNPTVVSGATASSGHYAGAAPTTEFPGTHLGVTLHSSVNDTRGTGAQVASGTGALTFKYSPS